MKPLTTLLALLAVVVPSHAASPQTCRIVAPSRVNRQRIISTAQTIPHHTDQPHFVVTAFAIPVAGPVAPFAPYWYGISDYHQTPSFPGSARERTAPEAMLRESPSEAQPVGQSLPDIQRQQRADRTSEPKRSIITQRCTSCHGRTSPKQGLSLADPFSLSDKDRLRAVRAVIKGDMPPDTEPLLTDDDRAALLAELSNATPTTERENVQ